MNNSSIYSRSLYYGLWILLLSASVTNAVNVISLLVFGSVIPILGQSIKYLTILASALMLIRIAKSYLVFIVGSLILFSFIWYQSYVYNVDASSAIESNLIPFFLEALPYMWIFYGFCKFDIGRKLNSFPPLFFQICRIKLILALFSQLIMFIFPRTDIFHDYMNAANAILLGMAAVTAKNIADKHSNKFDTFLEVIALIFILRLGSRGGILCYSSVYFLYYCFVSRAKEKRKAVLLVLGATTLLLIMGPFLLQSFSGSSSRYLTLFKSGELFHDQNRSLIFSIVYDNIRQNPMGMGVMADRPILLNSNEIWEVYYAHNMELEMGVNFGYLGFLISFGILFSIIYTLKRKISIDNKILLIAIVASSIVKLQVSSSYWIDPLFWGVIGYLLACRHVPTNRNIIAKH